MLNYLPSILKLRRPSDWTHQLILNKQTNKQTKKETIKNTLKNDFSFSFADGESS